MPVSILDTFPMGTARGNACYVCGAAQRVLDNGQRERVVDLCQTIDFEGYLMVCESCIVEAARLLGMETAERVAELRVELQVAADHTADAVAAQEASEARAQEAEQAFALAARLKEQPVAKPAPKSRAPKQLAETAPA